MTSPVTTVAPETHCKDAAALAEILARSVPGVLHVRVIAGHR